VQHTFKAALVLLALRRVALHEIGTRGCHVPFTGIVHLPQLMFVLLQLYTLYTHSLYAHYVCTLYQVRAVFSGHLCSNLVHRMGKVDISPEDKKMGALAAELKAKASTEATAAAAAAAQQQQASADTLDTSSTSSAQQTSTEGTVSDAPDSGVSPCHVDSDAEEVWVEEKVDMQHITTAAVAQGLRIARVYEEGIEHEFYTLDSVPHSVELRPARDAPHSSSSLLH
jgi:stage V sporulation protein SpoVS